jgi:hypothetical protein
MNGQVRILVDRVSKFLGTEHRWGDTKRIAEQIAVKTFGQDAIVYSYELELDVEQCLFYLPGAFDYLERSDAPDKEAGFETVLRGVVLSLNLWDESRIPQPIREITIQCFRELRLQLTHCFRCDEQWIERIDQDNSFGSVYPTIDVFWNELRTARLPCGETDLFSCLFSEWLYADPEESRSAFVLDLFLRSRLCPPPLDLMRDERLLRAAFDLSLCRQHWSVAEKLIRNTCSTKYVRTLQDALKV